MTDTPPATAAADGSEAPAPTGGLYDWITATNHATIGRLWLLGALPLLVAALVIGVVLGIERADAGSVDLFGGVNEYFRYWTLHRLGLPLLVVAPLFIGLATTVVPMQVGSTNIAFPRAALAAFWGWLLGAMLTVVSALIAGGWGALDGVDGDEADAIALTLVGTGMVVVSLLLASVCIATTVISLRTAGMTLLRVPLFAWSMLVASAVWLLTLPVLLANLTLAYVDLRAAAAGREFVFGNPEPSDPSIWSQVEWVTGQPQVFAFAIPALGVLGSVVPVTAGVRQVSHWMMVTLIGLFGLLSVGGWAQPAFQDDISQEFVFVVFGLAVALPVFGCLGGAAATLLAGRDRLSGLPTTALIGTLGATFVLLLAGAAAGLRLIEPFELDGTAAIGGVFTLATTAAVLGVVAGLWFWGPKITGTTLGEGLGRLGVLALVTGAVLAGAADVVSGFLDAGDLQLTTPTEDAVDALNAVWLVGAVIGALGALALVGAVARAVLSGAAPVPDDPWQGHTLEWTTSSPPAPGNFGSPLPVVRSEAPLLDEPAADGDGEEA